MKYQAKQFNGSAENAHQLMEWLGCGHFDMLIMPTPLSYIEIRYAGGLFKLYPMWWVVKREDGSVKVCETIEEFCDVGCLYQSNI